MYVTYYDQAYRNVVLLVLNPNFLKDYIPNALI